MTMRRDAVFEIEAAIGDDDDDEEDEEDDDEEEEEEAVPPSPVEKRARICCFTCE